MTTIDIHKPAPPATTQLTRRTPVRVAKTWDPDRRWHHPVVALLWVYVLGWLPVLTGLSAWLMLLVGVGATIAGVKVARRVYPQRIYGKAQADSAEGVAATAGIAATAWWVYAGHVQPTSLFALGLLILAGLIFGGCYALSRSHAPVRAAAMDKARDDARQRSFADMWDAILAQAGLPGCRVINKRDHRAGYTLSITSSEAKPVTVQTARGKLDAITVQAAFALAKAKITIGPDACKIEATPAAHVWLLHVTTRPVVVQDIAYPAVEPVLTIRRGLHLGLYQDGLELVLNIMHAHAKIVGATQSGKSTLLRVLIGQVTRCGDAMLWVGATDKLIPLVYRWLEPWLDGRMSRPVLDYVAGQEPREVLRMLACAYRVMRERNAALSTESSVTPTRHQPAIVVLLDEASDALVRPDKITTYDGREMDASQLFHEITKAGASAGVIGVLASQFGLVDMYGRWGSEMNRNLTIRVCLKTLTYHDGTSTLVGLDNVDTTKLLHHSMLVQPSTKQARAIAAKGFKLEDEQVGVIAVRNGANLGQLEEELADRLGPDYADRWEAGRLPELVTACRRNGHTWPGAGGDVVPAEDGAGPGEQGKVDNEFKQIVSHLEPSPMDARRDNPPTPAGLPNVDDAIADLYAIAARTGQPADQGQQRAEDRLPEPLQAIITALDAPNAPDVEWISTGKLAIVIDRVAADATEEQISEAAERLGRELSILVPNLRSRQRRVGEGRPRGYNVTRLRAAADAVRRGGELPLD